MHEQAAARLTLDRLSITDVRNLKRVTLEPAARVNVITGNNGQGKTSLLEAIYLVATTRSFRTAKLAELVMHDSRLANVRAFLTEHLSNTSMSREQSIGLQGSRKTVRLNGEAPATLSHFATRSPVVVFDPQQMMLSTGPAAGRRTLLDRVTLFSHEAVASHRTRYRRALRERQRVLTDRYPRLDNVPELSVFESLLAEHGSAITRARSQACEHLSAEMVRIFSSIAAPELTLSAGYLPGGSPDEEEVRQRLHDGRKDDGRRKRTGFGPHRDDLRISIDSHPARVVASQGQHRAITLALKIAEVMCIARARRVQPILLLDDVSSELDAQRTEALFEHLATTASQIFLTTTRRELIVTSKLSDERRDFFVEAGSVKIVE